MNPPALFRTLLEQAWPDVLALTALRQGENSETYRRRLGVADRLLEPSTPEQLTARKDDPDIRALRQEVEAGLGQVGYHGEDVQAVVRRLFGGAAGKDDEASLTELAIKLKQRARLGGEAGDGDKADKADKGDRLDKAERKDPTRPPKLLTPLNAEEQSGVERLRTSPFGSCFELQTNEQGDTVRRKLWGYSTVCPSRRRLAGCGADRDRYAAPGVAPRCELWQMQNKPAVGPFHPDGQLQQPFAQGGHLRGRTDSALGTSP